MEANSAKVSMPAVDGCLRGRPLSEDGVEVTLDLPPETLWVGSGMGPGRWVGAETLCFWYCEKEGVGAWRRGCLGFLAGCDGWEEGGFGGVDVGCGVSCGESKELMSIATAGAVSSSDQAKMVGGGMVGLFGPGAHSVSS